jgi:hypothetical protein
LGKILYYVTQLNLNEEYFETTNLLRTSQSAKFIINASMDNFCPRHIDIGRRALIQAQGREAKVFKVFLSFLQKPTNPKRKEYLECRDG